MECKRGDTEGILVTAQPFKGVVLTLFGNPGNETQQRMTNKPTLKGIEGYIGSADSRHPGEMQALI